MHFEVVGAPEFASLHFRRAPKCIDAFAQTASERDNLRELLEQAQEQLANQMAERSKRTLEEDDRAHSYEKQLSQLREDLKGKGEWALMPYGPGKEYVDAEAAKKAAEQWVSLQKSACDVK